MDKYFGFLESKEISNNTIKLMFDCVATIDFRPFSSLREISELRTLTISIEIPRHSKKHKEIQLLKQNRWHEIFLSTEIGNLFCSMIDISGGTINNESRIYKINTLKKRSKKNIELEKTFSLNRFTPSNKNSIKDVIDKIENHSFIINVMNVGQGNSIAAKDFYSSKELFYVDVGRGINQNYDININPAFHPSDEAFVILTHWDKDHWASSEVENRLKK
ncbi:hypothetical protein [Aeromonas sp. SG16]|uniref:hypothetical protein n=1 Tax=Aeromonas sp. SG16 TaxID=2950548 RepID=UPI00210B9628|nr:hypothetical protein [Aeromonas sp. SG16]MCQ4053369.1 hypothetical protein [Aeromonas sp. SG16]